MGKEGDWEKGKQAFHHSRPHSPFRVSLVLDPPGKVLISNNIETFVGAGSDNGVA